MRWKTAQFDGMAPLRNGEPLEITYRVRKTGWLGAFLSKLWKWMERNG